MQDKRHCLLVLKPHLDCCIFSISQCQGILSEVEGSVQLTSLYWPIQIDCFSSETRFFFVTKTTYLNEEVNCTEPSLSVWVPWSMSHVLWLQQKTAKFVKIDFFMFMPINKNQHFYGKLFYFIPGKLVKWTGIIKKLVKIW